MNYLKEYLRRTKTKYFPTFKGIKFKQLDFPIYLSKGKRYQIPIINKFHKMKYGQTFLERFVERYIKPIDKAVMEKEKN